MKLSVIIPALNEEANIERCIDSVKKLNPAEILVVDGGSSDRTKEIALSKGVMVIQSEKGRGTQMNRGASYAKGDILLFLHADSVFEDHITKELLDLKDYVAGFFRLRFDDRSLSVRLVEIFANLRSRLLHLPYGDQALFIKKETFQRIGGFRDYPFLEDLDLVLRLRRIGRLKGISKDVIASSRRLKKGYLLSPVFVSLRNVLIAMLFKLGISPDSLLRLYK